MSPVKEISEMLYQFDNDYIMSFEKFKQHFPNFSNGEKISSLFDELFLIDYELKKAWCSGLHTVFFKEVVD